MTKRKVKRRRGGTLNLLAGLLIASALVRLSTTTPQAFADAPAPDSAASEITDQMAAMEPETPDYPAMLKAFQERETRIQEREAQLIDRFQALRVVEDEVNEQLAALVAAEERLRETIALAEVAAQQDLQTLTQVYENMKPKDAAALFEQMAPEFAAGFLGLMRADAAAQIMTGLEPETAYSISVILAGRNAGVPTR